MERLLLGRCGCETLTRVTNSLTAFSLVKRYYLWLWMLQRIACAVHPSEEEKPRVSIPYVEECR